MVHKFEDWLTLKGELIENLHKKIPHWNLQAIRPKIQPINQTKIKQKKDKDPFSHQVQPGYHLSSLLEEDWHFSFWRHLPRHSGIREAVLWNSSFPKYWIKNIFRLKKSLISTFLKKKKSHVNLCYFEISNVITHYFFLTWSIKY